MAVIELVGFSPVQTGVGQRRKSDEIGRQTKLAITGTVCVCVFLIIIRR